MSNKPPSRDTLEQLVALVSGETDRRDSAHIFKKRRFTNRGRNSGVSRMMPKSTKSSASANAARTISGGSDVSDSVRSTSRLVRLGRGDAMRS